MNAKTYKWIVSVIVILVILFVGKFYILDKFSTNGSTQDTTSQTPLYELKSLETAVKTKKFETNQTSKIGFYQLSSGMKSLVPSLSTTEIKSSEGLAVDKTYKGQRVVFTNSSDVLAVYKYFMESIRPKFELVEGRRADNAGIMIIQDSSAVYRIEMIKVDDNLTSVSITSKNK